jgi:hypothetical protein
MKQGIYLTCCLRAKKLKEKGPQEETTRSGFIVEGQRTRAGGYKLTLNLLKQDKELRKATRTRPMESFGSFSFGEKKKTKKQQQINRRAALLLLLLLYTRLS